MTPKLIKITEIRKPSEKAKFKEKYGLFECPVCKKEYETIIKSVKYGKSTKCKNCSATIKKTTHGLRNHRLYRIWANIKQRTTNDNYLETKYYKEKGITVCSEWLNDFKSFYNWAMNNGYSDNLTIDRIDGNKGYYPYNCRWTTKDIQSQNTKKIRTNNTSGFRGVCYRNDILKFRTYITVNKKRIHLGNFDTAQDGAKAYDDYVISNNLEHTRNFS